MTEERATANRAIVLGLDGVPWDLLERWMDAGHLPNFAALADQGVAGPLESTRPASTPLAWPSIAAGVWPDAHGVYDFSGLRSDYHHRLNTSADWDALPMWAVASPAVVGNVPMTYPVGDVDGAMVGGMLSPGVTDRFAHPSSLAATVRSELPDYVVELDWNDYRDDRTGFVEDVGAMLSSRRAMFDLLADRFDWRLLFFVFTAPDRLQHLCWDEDVLLEHYRRLDDVVGDARERAAAAGANLYVVSDHGFGPVERHVHVNELLAREGYLTPKDASGTRGLLEGVGLTKGAVEAAATRLGLDWDRTLQALPRWLVDAVADRVPGHHGLHDIDYGASRAFLHGAGNVYVNDAERFEQGVVDPADRAEVAAAVREDLAAVRDPETGEPALAVHDGAALFPRDDRSPDLVVEPRDGYSVEVDLSATPFVDARPQAGDHRVEGVLLAAGPDVDGDARPQAATVVDVAPTVLHGLGEAVPAAVDGSVLDVFAPESGPGRRAVECRGYDGSGAAAEAGDDDFSEVEDRLRGLGYVD